MTAGIASRIDAATLRRLARSRWTAALIMLVSFIAAAMAFFAINGREPLGLFLEMVMGGFGDGYSISETLVKTSPILLTALAIALPARLGLISVGAEGQLYLGALFGTGAVLLAIDQSGWLLMPLMLAGAMVGGALWGAVPGLMKTRLGVNETISTLLLNYVGILLVSFVVHGPWKNPDSQGWPATVEFPEGAILPQFFDTRVHMGLVFGVVAAVILHVLVTRSRWGLGLQVSRSNPRVGTTAGISYERNVLLVMAIGGLLAGLAGIAEASVIQNRLQDGLATGYGLTGFLVAWLAGQHFLRIIPLSILMGGLMASADALQLFAQLPKASADILQAVLFIIVLAVGGLWNREGLFMEMITTETLALLFAALRSATPVLAVVLGEIMTQRSGVINLGVEGQMLLGAMTGFAVTAITGDPWLGVLAACGAGMLLSLVHAALVLGCHANQIASGVAVMILGSGLSGFYGIPYVGEKINSFGSFKGSAMAELPVIGQFLGALTPTVLITLASIPLISLFLYRTLPGLHWRSVGEAADITRNLGHNPVLYQLAAILFGGFMSGFAGAALAVDYTSNWVEYMTAGRGLVAVGLVIVARWNPWYALPAALLFGVSESLNLRLQSWGVDVSQYLLATLPYLIPLVVLMLSFRGLKAGGGMPMGLKAVFQGS